MKYYLDDMGLLETKMAYAVAAVPKEVADWIFEPNYIKKSPIQRIA